MHPTYDRAIKNLLAGISYENGNFLIHKEADPLVASELENELMNMGGWENVSENNDDPQKWIPTMK